MMQFISTPILSPLDRMANLPQSLTSEVLAVGVSCTTNMKTTLRKWGNSLAIRIPKSFAAEIKIHEGHSVDVCVAKGRIVAPISAKDYHLDDLVAAITRKNLHGEVTTSVAQGREIW